jgi:outer membrane murein-binding lipoprotein Lpp
MNRLIAIILVLGSVLLSGCGDKEAREYAAKLIPVLDSYQEQLSQKIKVEQDSYQELADNFEQARQDDIKTKSEKERFVRAEDLGVEIAGSKSPPSLLKILDEVQKYADEDFKTSKELLQEGLDTRSKHLSDLESLEVELQKIKLLKESLTELAKGKSGFKQFKEATEFVLQTDSEINKLLCVDLKKELADLTAEKAKAEKEKTPDEKAIAALDQKISRLNERITTKKCP